MDHQPSSAWQPHLSGPTLDLRPLVPEDFDRLYEAASDPLIWKDHPSPLRYQHPIFADFFTAAQASGGALVVIDRETAAIVGSSRYYEWNAADRSVAIGYTFLARAFWGGATNAEMKGLMLDHAFKSVETVWFHVGPDNLRSQKAMTKIGARLDHRGTRTMFGLELDYLYYRIDAGDDWHGLLTFGRKLS